jgi:hypothetical protein
MENRRRNVYDEKLSKLVFKLVCNNTIQAAHPWHLRCYGERGLQPYPPRTPDFMMIPMGKERERAATVRRRPTR